MSDNMFDFEYLKWPGGIKPSIELCPLKANSYSDGQFLRNIFFDVALDDLTASILLYSNTLGAQSAFMAGQAAEKMLKGLLLTVRGSIDLKTHSLTILLNEIKKVSGETFAEINYLNSSLFDFAQTLEEWIGKPNTKTRYPEFTLEKLEEPYKEHPVVSFHQYIIGAALEYSASISNWALYWARIIDGRGYEGRQLCYYCRENWRPVYCSSTLVQNYALSAQDFQLLHTFCRVE